ncbi:hypothetical protein ABGT15_04360 [Flavobacterium enshiense]|uniref:hypothetical protein n=1 Tax=Flavobacterium enshiense TaxID=1341165 RepID=UPI00345CCF5D
MKEELKELGKEFLLASYIDVDFDYEDLSDEYRDKYSMLLDEYNGDVDDLISALEGEFIYKPARDLIKDFIDGEINEGIDGIEGVEYFGDNSYIVKLDFSDKHYIKSSVDIELDGDEIVYDYYDVISVYEK